VRAALEREREGERERERERKQQSDDLSKSYHTLLRVYVPFLRLIKLLVNFN